MVDLLGVDNVQQTLDQGQETIKVNDDTDLEAAAQFDFLAWAEERGLIGLDEEMDENFPAALQRKSLEEKFTVPFSGQVSEMG